MRVTSIMHSFLSRVPRRAAWVVPGLVALALAGACGHAKKDIAEAEKLATQGKFLEARAAFERAIRGDSSAVAAWIGRGQICMLTGAPDLALQSFERAVKLDPASEIAWLGLARSNRRMMLTREAIDAYQHAMTLAPEDGMPYYELATLHAENNLLAEALPLIEKACARLPQHGAAWFTWAGVAARAGQDSVAGAALDHLLEIRPEFAPGWYERSALLLRRGDLDGAVSALEKTLSLDPAMDVARLNLGVIHASRREDSRAEAEWTRVVESSQDSVMVSQARQNLELLKEGRRPVLSGRMPPPASPPVSPSGS